MEREKNPTKATWRCPRVHRGSATNKLDETDQEKRKRGSEEKVRRRR